MTAVFPPDRPNPPDLVPFAEARAGVLADVTPPPVLDPPAPLEHLIARIDLADFARMRNGRAPAVATELSDILLNR